MQSTIPGEHPFVDFLDISVAFQPCLDGGGSRFGQEFVQVVAATLGFSKHVFEFRSGPGFIGVLLLAHGICERLTLAHINPAAITACQTTIQSNQLDHRRSAHVSDGLADIPNTEYWDLIVGNPPHWPKRAIGDSSLLKHDIDLQVHQRFFQRAPTVFKDGGVRATPRECACNKPCRFRADDTSMRPTTSRCDQSEWKFGFLFLTLPMTESSPQT
jgi:hypothetical protein